MNYKRLIVMMGFMLFSLGMAFAQSSPTRITGSFEPSSTCKVNYSISPAPFTDNMVLELNVTETVALTAHIINENGTELLSIDAPAALGRSGKNVDISTLAPGNYFVEILYGANSEHNYRIAFTKP